MFRMWSCFSSPQSHIVIWITSQIFTHHELSPIVLGIQFVLHKAQCLGGVSGHGDKWTAIKSEFIADVTLQPDWRKNVKLTLHRNISSVLMVLFSCSIAGNFAAAVFSLVRGCCEHRLLPFLIRSSPRAVLEAQTHGRTWQQLTAHLHSWLIPELSAALPVGSSCHGHWQSAAISWTLWCKSQMIPVDLGDLFWIYTEFADRLSLTLSIKRE